MADYRLSNQARADLRDIARYTFQNWGPEQASQYINGFLRCFQTIADSPQIGRSCDQVRTGYRRMEHGRHVVFYRVEASAVVIGRILHQRMMPKL